MAAAGGNGSDHGGHGGNGGNNGTACDEWTRLVSLLTLPARFFDDVDQLFDGGFYKVAGTVAVVRCCACRYTVDLIALLAGDGDDDDENDDIDRRHLRHDADCSFARHRAAASAT